MKIYAIRDNLIDYFMQPFAAPDDRAVLAAIATQINTQGNMNDIAQAPHYFEVWKLGEVTDQGNIVPGREKIANCSSLIRTGLRGDNAPEPREGPAGRPVIRSTEPPERTSQPTSADPSAIPGAPPSQALQGDKPHPEPGRSTTQPH